ncbi:MAG: hypothetical protein ACXAEN_13345 [Candidatus Thorarchaeota archaeon]
MADILGMRVRVCLPALLLLESDDGRVINIYPSGRILLRKFPDEEAAERFAEKLGVLFLQG